MQNNFEKENEFQWEKSEETDKIWWKEYTNTLVGVNIFSFDADFFKGCSEE